MKIIAGTKTHYTHAGHNRQNSLVCVFLIKHIDNKHPPYVRYIAGYALHDSTGMIASNSHDTIERMDDIISVYGENPT